MLNPIIRINQLHSIDWMEQSLSKFDVGDSCDIWAVRISEKKPAIDHMVSLLEADEIDRANRYYREHDKQRFIISRAYLRALIGKYLRVDPTEISFESGTNKKPFLKGSKLQYNLSHSGDYILMAISNHPIGVDVECPDPLMHYDDIMEISFSDKEKAFVKDGNEPVESFYRLWTRKEALLKANGKGIDDDLKFIPCLDGETSISASVIGSGRNWVLSTFKIDDKHVGSVASPNGKFVFWKAD